ncbi:vitamin K epoxide reductase family protein [Candidatus Woesearchaeota archaeon]|nr:vitamin K epoxide reductase family protein [Candidatus Woesearchaeota archaeon]
MKEIYLIILSIIGFAVSFYIFYSKKYNKPLYCPIGENCDDVVRSKYGKTFGVENTIPGMGYYVLVSAYATGMLSNQNVFKGVVFYYLIVGMTFGAVMFSAYLTYVQKFILKKWCYYCIVSSIASILILGVLIYG